MSEEKYYGGQAVIEGVMIRGKQAMATACRLPSGEIRVVCEPVRSVLSRYRRLNIPFVRGTPALIDALSIGFRSMLLSADLALAGEGKQPMNRAWFALSLVLALILGIGLFVVVPTILANTLHGGFIARALEGVTRLPAGSTISNLVEGGIRLVVLLAYLLLIMRMRDVRRLFEYHGAEHQVVNAYEHGRPLAEAAQFDTIHKRCGTAFIAVFIIVGVVVHSLMGWPRPLLLVISRIAVIPVIAGIAFEIIKATGKRHDSWWYLLVGWPGLLLQRITTSKPSPDQVEVATRAMESVLEAEQAQTA